MDRRDLDVGLQDPEAALDVCKAFVLRNSLGRRQIRGIGDQCNSAIKQLGSSNSIVVDRPTEPLGREVNLEEARHLGFSDGAGEAAVGTAVRGATALGGLAGILGIELADHLLDHGLQLGDASTPPIALFSRPEGIMGHNEPMFRKAAICQVICIEGQSLEGFREVGIAVDGNRQDELEPPFAPDLMRRRLMA